MPPEIIGRLEWNRKIVLGEGLSIVYSGKFYLERGWFSFSRPRSLECAVKRLYKDRTEVRTDLGEIRSLTALCNTIEDIPLIKYFHCEEDNDFWYIAMEKFDCNLREYLEGRDGDNNGQNVDLSLQAAQGLTYLHDKGFVHKDIKPTNYMVHCQPGARVICKLGDFGFSKRIIEGKSFCSATGRFGTLNWTAPEMARADTAEFSKKSDIWSLGCVIYYTIHQHHRHPFEEVIDEQQLANNLEDMRRNTPTVDVNFISRMISSVPINRPLMRDVVGEIQNWVIPV